MMRDVPDRVFFDPESAHRRLAKTQAEQDLVDWLRAAARDRSTDFMRGGPFWYVVEVRIGCEVRTAIRLLRDRVKAFCPRETVVEKKPRGKGTRVVRKPMYPGYLFVELAPGEACWAGLLTYEGVASLVPQNDRPVRVTAKAMAEVRRVSRRKRHKRREAPTLFIVGEEVRVKDGPFDSFDGVVSKADNAAGRLKVDVMLLGRAVSVDLEVGQVDKA